MQNVRVENLPAPAVFAQDVDAEHARRRLAAAGVFPFRRLLETHPNPAAGAIVSWEWDFDWNPTGLAPTKPLTVKYRVWVQSGETTVEKCEEMAKAFVSGK